MFGWFSGISGLGMLSVGASLFNTYAQNRANNEARSERTWTNQQMMRFDQAQVKQATQEYGVIASYHIDQLRQKQLAGRQQLGYNIINSGIGITSTDTAGLLLRFQGYQDEMAARAEEAEYIYRRPKSSLNTEVLKHGIDRARSAAPFETIGTVLSGARDLASVLRTEGVF
jgi:hypothetical protein